MFLEASIISIFIAKIRKGKFMNLEEVDIRGWYLFIISALLQASLSILKKLDISILNITFNDYFIYVYVFSYILIMICVGLNIKSLYMKIFLIGIILNFIVIFANGGQMPVSLDGIRGIHIEANLPKSEFDIKHKAVDENTKLVYLSDIILIPPPYILPKILSIGDIFLIAGLFTFFQKEMLRGKSTLTNKV